MANNNRTEEINAAKRILVQNPISTNQWIDIAATFMVDFGGLLEAYKIDIYKYDADQLKVIYDIINYVSPSEFNRDLQDIFLNEKINSTKMQIALGAYKSEVSMDIIKSVMRPHVPFVTANLIISAAVDEGMLGDFAKELIKYMDDGFSTDQVFEIFSAHNDGVNILFIADKDIPAPMMSIMRHALNEGFNVNYNKETKELLVTPKPNETEAKE